MGLNPNYTMETPIDLSYCQTIVLDECDKQFGQNQNKNKEDGTTQQSTFEILAEICAKTSVNTKYIMVSATMNEEIQKILFTLAKNPVYRLLRGSSSLKTIEYNLITLSQKRQQHKENIGERMEILQTILGAYPGRKIVFFSRIDNIINFCDMLDKEDMLVETIRDAKEQVIGKKKTYAAYHRMIEKKEDKIKVIEDFRNGVYQTLFTTNALARGIDFDNLDIVINFDVPYLLRTPSEGDFVDDDFKKRKREKSIIDFDTMVHRLGRVGRNGKRGYTFTIVTDEQRSELANNGKISFSDFKLFE